MLRETLKRSLPRAAAVMKERERAAGRTDDKDPWRWKRADAAAVKAIEQTPRLMEPEPEVDDVDVDALRLELSRALAPAKARQERELRRGPVAAAQMADRQLSSLDGEVSGADDVLGLPILNTGFPDWSVFLDVEDKLRNAAALVGFGAIRAA